MVSVAGRTLAPIASAPAARPTREYLERWLALWWAGDDEALPPGRTYSPREQHSAEAELERLLAAALAEAEHAPQSEAGRRAAQARLLAAAAPLAHSLLGAGPAVLQALAESGLAEAAVEFVRAARRFDPAISAEDVYQAMRNVWSMNGLQLLLGLEVRLTPAIFAYSMLYPYTDNYLDDPAVPPEAKAAFGARFGRRLAGEPVQPQSPHEARIYHLVAMIEGQYPRACYPQVHESLLAIHAAQTRSIALLRHSASPYAVDVLGITFAKGGLAVLADGYLVAGQLTDAQAEFMFGYGAFTQLMDDMEDVAQDRQAGLATLFSQTAGRWPLDGVTARTFHLGARLLERLHVFPAPGAAPLCALMEKGLAPALAACAGRAARWHSPAGRQALEARSPFGFAFLERLQRKLARRRLLERVMALA